MTIIAAVIVVVVVQERNHLCQRKVFVVVEGTGFKRSSSSPFASFANIGAASSANVVIAVVCSLGSSLAVVVRDVGCSDLERRVVVVVVVSAPRRAERFIVDDRGVTKFGRCVASSASSPSLSAVVSPPIVVLVWSATTVVVRADDVVAQQQHNDCSILLLCWMLLL